MPADYGEAGELATRGDHLLKRYVDNDEATEEFYRTNDGWGWTGDLAVKHKAGYISLTGRVKEMILSGGVNIFPAELEAVLLEHPAVEDAAAFAVPDPTWGELPAAAVVLRKGADADGEDIMAHVADRVARYKRLRAIVFVDEIPRTPIGKIKRAQLMESCKNIQIATDGPEKATS